MSKPLARRAAATAVALATSALVTSGLAVPASADPGPSQSASDRLGTRSLADVLAADGRGFDKQWRDFDILDRAVTTVLKEKPDSAVSALARGDQRLTGFLPTDRGFRKFVGALTGTWSTSERQTFDRVAGLVDVDTLETVLLYHVVPGATITARQAARADGAELPTASGGSVTVRVRGDQVRLRDADRDAVNPEVTRFNINKGNRQIAHAINRVLRPVDL